MSNVATGLFFAFSLLQGGPAVLPLTGTQSPPWATYTGQGFGDSWLFHEGGDYVVSLNLSLSQAGQGWVYWQNVQTGEVIFLLRYKPEAWAVQHGQIHFRANAGESWRLAYAGESLAIINNDSRASKLTIWKLP